MRSLRSLILGLSTLLAAMPVSGQVQEAPRGWMGLLITTGIGQATESGAMVFNDYPVIESIDPGSPAEKAGLQSGDVLISINKQDFKRNPIPMNSLLVPGQKVMFRYRRNDVAMTATLTVAERPAGTSRHLQLSIIGPTPPRGAMERAQVERSMQQGVHTRMTLMPSIALGAPLVFGTGTPSITIAGAELTHLNDDLRQALKVKGDGVFVVNVTTGTPAGDAGLKGGDVIVRAADEMLQNPGQLIRLIEAAQNNALAIRILRNQKLHNLTLRW